MNDEIYHNNYVQLKDAKSDKLSDANINSIHVISLKLYHL